MCISVDLAHTTADDGSEIFLPTLHFLCPQLFCKKSLLHEFHAGSIFINELRT